MAAFSYQKCVREHRAHRLADPSRHVCFLPAVSAVRARKSTGLLVNYALFKARGGTARNSGISYHRHTN